MTEKTPPPSSPARQWRDGLDHLPTLHLEDVSGVPFVSGVPGVEQYQHRARVRAGEGDLFAAATAPAPGYEEYCREHLGLGRVDCVLAEPLEDVTQVARACARGEALARLVERARGAGGMVIHPYMGIAPVWDLAAAIEARAGAPVYVLAPTVEVCWVANDKRSLDAIARELGLADALVETEVARTPQGMAAALRELAGRHRRVALKRTRCASAMGNALFDGAALLAEDAGDTRARVEAFLERTEWEDDEEVLIVEWAPATGSPSTQLWIPPGGGEIRVDGLYEQLLEGPERVFLGSRPSTLPAYVEQDMTRTSLAVAEVFQRMGYAGRCSFDFIIVGAPERGDAEVKLVECNGRWGGTSTPMTLVDRVWRGSRPHYVAQDVMHPALEGVTFPEILARTREHLFDPRTQRGRFLYYNVGPLAERGKLDVISIGADPKDAMRGVRELLPTLLGVSG